MSIKSESIALIKNITEPQTDAPAPSWVNQVAMLTGALAALAGFLTVRSTILTNEAIYESNQAILSQTQASDAWAEYQADSIKAHMVEVQLVAGASQKQQFESMAKELRDRQPALKTTALAKTKERDDHLGNAQKRLGEKDILGYAGMVTQLGIALASVAALVRKRPVFYIAVAAGAAGAVLTGYTFIADYLPH